MLLPLRPLLIGLLALVVAIGSTAQGSLVSLQRFAPDPLAAHGHAAAHLHAAAGTHDHGDHGAAQSEKQQHSSQKCCGLCVIISSTAPAAPCAEVALIESRVFYLVRERPEPGQIVLLDPGIPKQTV